MPGTSGGMRVGLGLDDRLGQRGHRHLADGGGGDRCGDRAGAAEEVCVGKPSGFLVGSVAGAAGCGGGMAGPAASRARLGLPISAMSRSAWAIQKSRSASM